MFFLKYSWVIFLTFVEINGDYCLTNDNNPFTLFSTKTAYEQVRGSAGSETTCEPIQIWMLNRHGTRHADAEDLIEMKKAIDLQKDLINHYESGLIPQSGRLCEDDYNAIKNWKWDESMENEPEFLNHQGWQDLFSLASRYKTRYPSILQVPYTSDHYYFRHTPTQRTENSCKAFIDGLFGNGSFEYVKIEEPNLYDDIIYPYKTCQLWLDEVDTNPDRKEEKRAFRKSDVYKELLADVTKKMGYNKTLSHDDIDTMYDNCRFDKTKYMSEISPWCSIFTKKELFLMEYYEDLGRYYKSGYGNEMHKKLGCMPLKNLMETFEKTVINNGSVVGPKLTAMFSHDTMLDMMYTAMDFAHDQQQLKGTDFEDLLVNRKYSTSRNTPFAANVVAVLHDCLNIENDRFQVQFFINERPMELKGCYRGLCSWQNLEQYFPSYKQCNIDFCNDASLIN